MVNGDGVVTYEDLAHHESENFLAFRDVQGLGADAQACPKSADYPRGDFPTAQDLGAKQRHHHRVLDIMVERIGEPDPLKGEPCRGGNCPRVIRLAAAVDASVLTDEPTGHRLEDKGRGVRHGSPPPIYERILPLPIHH